MKFLQILRKAATSSPENRRRFSSIPGTAGRFSNRVHSQTSNPASFGIAFDIDGVILRGETPIGGSPQALKRLYEDSGTLRTPYVFLTNGGGLPESSRATELSKLLNVHISPAQVIQGHSPFKQLVKRFENELIIAVGKGEPALVMSEYGFKRNDFCSQRVQAVFIVSDSVDWSRDIQVLCDILSTGGLPGKEVAKQPPLYFASDDLSYQGIFPTERLGMGAFRIALESVYNSPLTLGVDPTLLIFEMWLVTDQIALKSKVELQGHFLKLPRPIMAFMIGSSFVYPNVMEYTSYGKPNPSVFSNAENVLMQVCSSISPPLYGHHSFKTLYMIGDNPSVDIKGAQQAGKPWFSILTRSGVYKGKNNHPLYPADLVVDNVEEAVDYILRKEAFQPDLYA